MNNAFQTELLKLRKNKMALIGFASTVSVPILLVLKSVLIDKSKIDYQEWLQTVSMLVNIILPIMSGFFITQSMQKEYGEKTIINIITAPVNRKNFVLSKIAVWLCWYLAVMILTEGITIVGSLYLFRSQVTITSVYFTVRLLTQIGILSFIAFLPVIWLAVRQRTLFYPTMLCTLLFVLLQSVGSQVSEELLPAASFVPWLAIQISAMLPSDSQYLYICITSILCSGLLGSVLAVREFKRQDL
ncbi:ABC transporter permease [Lactonifactor longoviformis]|uniref:ABC-2 type transport system permease protein n=1 Tax=Lactonifactor longoviformis DSM 17459 TaxID=1122155 RepID=A0A1M4ZZ55_9CLOT|nr:ABC transporter permease [Lactonifactor longoviformis]POP34948.1 ABC transporter permease [Lactonifactor longoviformis]SHF23309.1 ABC-2 type transport system permease protein [Lactonifactor longoviformis DSM 17459]